MFDYKKHYVFSVDKYIMDMAKLGRHGEDIKVDCEIWANKIDGHIVRYVYERKGYCDGYLVHFDWCVEVHLDDM